MAIKNRAELKSYFVKNAIPTEENFADLIDSQLNQAQDGVFKREREPLSVVAAPGDQKRVLWLYSNSKAAQPDWMISLNPAQDPANAATSKPGFGITDGAGQTRLFVDAGGRVGVGTNAPESTLDVAGGVHVQGDVQVNGVIKDRTGFVIPPGGIIMWSGDPARIPEGWVLCNGKNGTPDLRDRFVLGHGPTSPMHGTGGASKVALAIKHMPRHNHDNGNYKYLVQKHPHGRHTSRATDTTKGQIDTIHGAQIKPAGDNEPHENMPPYYVLAFIMKQ